MCRRSPLPRTVPMWSIISVTISLTIFRKVIFLLKNFMFELGFIFITGVHLCIYYSSKPPLLINFTSNLHIYILVVLLLFLLVVFLAFTNIL